MKEFAGKRGLDIRLTALFVENLLSQTNMLEKLGKKISIEAKICQRCGKEESKLATMETHIGKAQRSDGGSNILPLPNEGDTILFQATKKKSKRGSQDIPSGSRHQNEFQG